MIQKSSFSLETATSWVFFYLPLLCGADGNMVFHPNHQGEERISIIKNWRQEGHATNRNKETPYNQMSF